ncbi:Exonuclease 3'-5' domain-containing protein 2 [Mactra antiquata]
MDGNSLKYFTVPVCLAAFAVWTVYKQIRSIKQKLKFRDKNCREIHIVNNVEDWERVYPILATKISVVKALGFDCEWVFEGSRFPVALIQLATYDGFCVLIRIFLMDDIPETLSSILADKRILKVGVASRDDGRKLTKDYGLIVRGCVDLRHILARTRGFKCTSQSLQGLAKGILDVNMSKDRSIRCGDWEAMELSEEQISYAADDALIGIDVFISLVLVKINGISALSGYYGTAVSTDVQDLWRVAGSVCQGIVDIAYKSKSAASLLQTNDFSSDDDDVYDNASTSKPTSSTNRSGRQKSAKKAFMTRKRALYHNCQLLAPDDTMLTLCDIRKVDWYLSKGLAVKVSDDPVCIKLKFEPKKQPGSDRDYYLQEKENICVVCGATEDYVRKIVVPKEYRKYFPTILKDHSSHDVLLLCINCHLKCADYEMELRQMLAMECNAPLDSGKDSKRRWDQDLAKVVSAAKALLKCKDQIPEKRVHELEETVKRFYGVQSLPIDLLHQAMAMEPKINNAKFVPHGKKVVEYYMNKHGGLLEFEKMWRQHFVDIMQPKHLPYLWSIEHKPEKLLELS